jgi:hypothetical protein
VAAAIVTGADGVATVRWALDPGGETTQTLTIRRLDAHDAGIDVAVVVTGRLSLASEVAWTPPVGCTGFAATGTVQEALTELVRTSELRLLGGDGQSVESQGQVVPQPIRVVLDSPCGPLVKARVSAVAGDAFTGPGLVVEAVAGQRPPATLEGTPAGSTAVATTDADGVASFWWQPAFGNVRSATLDVFSAQDGENKDAPVRVGAQLDPAGSRPPGLHVEKIAWGNGRTFLNDAFVGPREIAAGVSVTLDGAVAVQSVRDKPVVRMLLALPWPVGPDLAAWDSPTPVGFQEIEVLGDADVDGSQIVWRPRNTEQNPVVSWLEAGLWDALNRHKWTAPLRGRFVIDGWAVLAQQDPSLHLNGHAATTLVGGRTHVVLPTDDAVTGGTFTQWFRITDQVGPDGPPRAGQVVVRDITGRTQAVAVRLLTADGLVAEEVEEPDAGVRKGQVVRTDPAAGAEVEPGSTVVVVVSSGRGG